MRCLSGRPALCTREGLERGPDEPPRLAYKGERVHAMGRIGGFAEQLLVHEHGVVPIRKDMPLDRAALIGCAVTTGVGAVTRTAQVAPGSTVAVLGCGGIGLSAIQGASIAGASGGERSPDRLLADYVESVDLNSGTAMKDAVEALQRRLCERALREADGNQTQAAAKLGLHRNSLRRLLDDLQ